MVYIVILNWNNGPDTLACLASLFKMKNISFRIVICDNSSTDGSYVQIRDGISNLSGQYFCKEINKETSESYIVSEDVNNVFLIQTGANLGFAGGNNVGIRFALNQPDMNYVWLLNNDTTVEPNTLELMVSSCETDSRIGICGSRLIYSFDKNKMQGLGGIYNSWLGSCHHYAENEPANKQYDSSAVSLEIDYIIGASMLLTKTLLCTVGLLCEDYFLYFEELDLSIRARQEGFKNYVNVDAVVYHKEGGSAGHKREKSDFADLLAIKNRLKITKKFFKYKYMCVWLGTLIALVNRIRRRQWTKAKNIVYILLAIN